MVDQEFTGRRSIIKPWRKQLHPLSQPASLLCLRLPRVHQLPLTDFLLSLRWCTRLTHLQPGKMPVTAGDLSRLLAPAREAAPDLWSLEDFLPPDPRETVLVRWGKELFRLTPSALERPVAVVERARMVIAVVDNVLIARLGFGLSDLTELVLRHVDAVVGTLAPTWHDEPSTVPGSEAAIREEELQVALALPAIDKTAQACSSPERARLALKWATVNVKDLTLSLGDPDSIFGSVLAVRFKNGHIRALPAAMCIEGLHMVVRFLAEQAATFDPTLQHRFAIQAAQEVNRLLSRTRCDLRGPFPDGNGGFIHALVRFGDQTWLAVQVVSSLTISNLDAKIQKSAEQLKRVRPGSRISL